MMVLPPSSSVLWRELVTVICSITSFSNKSGRFGVHASIMYTRYRTDKWQKEKWIASREGSFSSGSFPSSCECSLLTLLAPSSASIPFPAVISRGNSPNSVFLHLQNITFIIRQCFFPVSPTYLGAVSRSISPAGSHSQGMGSGGHSSQAGLRGHQVVRVTQITDGGGRGESVRMLSQLCAPLRVIHQR